MEKIILKRGEVTIREDLFFARRRISFLRDKDLNKRSVYSEANVSQIFLEKNGNVILSRI